MATANNLGTAYIRIAPQMKGIQSTIQSSFGKAGGTAAASFSSNFASKWGKAAGLVAGVAATAVSKAVGAVVDTFDAAISRADTLNAFPKIMKNLGFSTKESDAALQKLSDRIEGLPTTLDGIVSYTQRLASSTGKLNKGVYNATNLAIAFNDAALAGGKGQYEANRAFEQFVQVISRGRPSMQDWKIMMEVMPGQLKQLAKYMGKNSKSFQAYAKEAKKTVDQLDGLDLYEWISEDKNAYAKERLGDLQKALIDLDNKGGAGIVSFKDQVGDATHTIGNALSLIKVRITKALANIIQAFGAGDIYDTIDKFTSSFKKVGDWVIEYVVPPLRDDIVPALKDVIKAIASVIKWVAETEGARKALVALLKAFIAFKVVTAIGSTIKAFVVNIMGVITAVKGAIVAVSTFTKVLAASGSLNVAFMNTAASATGAAAGIARVGEFLTRTVTIAGVSVSMFTALATAIGGVVVVAGSFAMAMEADRLQQERAQVKAEEYSKTLISEENATRRVTRAHELEKEILEDIERTKRASTSAELAYLDAKQDEADTQAELNRLAREGKKGTDEYRRAELRHEEAIARKKDTQKKFNKAKKEEAQAQEQYRTAAYTEISQSNLILLSAEARRKKYGVIAKQLDDLSKKTYTYKDANGKLAQATRKDMEDVVDHLSQELSRNDETWRKIREHAQKNGMSYVDAIKSYGRKAGKGLQADFAIAVTEDYLPLATKAIQSSTNAIVKKIHSMLPFLSNASIQAGYNLMAGLVKGIKSKVGKVKSTVDDGIRDVLKIINKVPEIHSPSRVTAQSGRYIMEGLAVGIESYQSKLNSVADLAMQSMLSHLNGDANIALGTSGLSSFGQSQMNPSQTQVIQNNTFNQVDSTLDVKEASRLLGWQVATSI